MSKEVQTTPRDPSATTALKGLRKAIINLSKLNLIDEQQEKQLDTIHKAAVNKWVENELRK